MGFVGGGRHVYVCIPRVSGHGWSWDGENIMLVVVLVHVSTVTLEGGVTRYDGDGDDNCGRPSVRGTVSVIRTWYRVTSTSTTVTTVYGCSCPGRQWRDVLRN